jgi:hypothetical protein
MVKVTKTASNPATKPRAPEPESWDEHQAIEFLISRGKGPDDAIADFLDFARSGRLPIAVVSQVDGTPSTPSIPPCRFWRRVTIVTDTRTARFKIWPAGGIGWEPYAYTYSVTASTLRELVTARAAPATAHDPPPAAPVASAEQTALPLMQPDPFRTGGQGRPTGADFIKREAARRLADAKTPQPASLSAFAKSLANWWETERKIFTPHGPELRKRAIETKVREMWNSRTQQ